MSAIRRLARAVFNSPTLVSYRTHGAFDALAAQAHRPIGGPLLELGCGDGATTEAILHQLPKIAITAIDQDQRHAERAASRLGERAVVLQGPHDSLGFDDASFGTVVAWNVLENLPEPRTALGEIFRVLRVRGQILFTDYAWSSHSPLVRRMVSPASCFTRQDLEIALADVGFAGISLDGRRRLRGRATKPVPSDPARGPPPL